MPARTYIGIKDMAGLLKPYAAKQADQGTASETVGPAHPLSHPRHLRHQARQLRFSRRLTRASMPLDAAVCIDQSGTTARSQI